MDDGITRAEFSRRVFELLGNREFRNRLEVKSEDGDFPIVTAMMDDSLESTLHAVAAAGHRANVALSFIDGFTVMSMDLREAISKAELVGTQHVDISMSMRQFFAMVVANDDGQAYRFQVDGELGAPKNAGFAKLAQVGA